GCDGFFWLAGQGGYGIMTSPAISLMAAPASADTKVRLGSLQSAPVTTETAISYHYWQFGGTKRTGVTRYGQPYDIAGVYSSGKYGKYSSTKLMVYLHATDTRADGLAAGIELKVPGKAPIIFAPSPGYKTVDVHGTVPSRYIYIREVLGHRNTSTHTFTVTKAGSYKKFSA
ncbi:MAG: hypothetical protein ACJ72W_12750, partial [Actinoallomurus sp.]